MDSDSIEKVKNDNTIVVAPKSMEDIISKIEFSDYIYLEPFDEINIDNINIEVILTSSKSNIQTWDVQKFNKEYPTLKIAKTDKFHDRFIIIDNKELYHCGASIKDLGKKCFAISRVENEEFIEIIKKII